MGKSKQVVFEARHKTTFSTITVTDDWVTVELHNHSLFPTCANFSIEDFCEFADKVQLARLNAAGRLHAN